MFLVGFIATTMVCGNSKQECVDTIDSAVTDSISTEMDSVTVKSASSIKYEWAEPLKEQIKDRFCTPLAECSFTDIEYQDTIFIGELDCKFTEFFAMISIPEWTPLTIKEFISKTIQEKISIFNSDYSSKSDNAKEVVSMADMSKCDIKSMIDHYHQQYIKILISDYMMWQAVYRTIVCPVWRSSDGALSTWMFYTEIYNGGAHGATFEYYLTFDHNTGKFIGCKDLMSMSEIKKAYKVLKKKLNDRFKGIYDSQEVELSDDSFSVSENRTYLYENINGRIYPRGAITSKGLVFSYQTYEKGSGADGVLLFDVPYTYKGNK